ncbi:DUF29 domain-containing protein [Crocosphaera sp. XPORK-15E]|uniref:DUF29 domain-containing protein n=1 Tax=Crocosphaera sp. XPORK-15E TaxID=3110247 RepID=UPI002B21467A|nr:DUF29 domain-containing protein [Crocosphaera sp. XPORK-15E]MEA5536468.1 DUF29 domain-containing protein [Crocosphaera sp. XPORK-15E]
MKSSIDKSLHILYEKDYYLWLGSTIEKLRCGQFSTLDLENLIKELESMGRTDLRTANSLIKQIIIHRLKLDNLPDLEPRKHWQKEINNFQEQLEDLLSTSLQAKIDLEKIYKRAKREFLVDYSVNLPEKCPYIWDELFTD